MENNKIQWHDIKATIEAGKRIELSSLMNSLDTKHAEMVELTEEFSKVAHSADDYGFKKRAEFTEKMRNIMKEIDEINEAIKNF